MRCNEGRGLGILDHGFPQGKLIVMENGQLVYGQVNFFAKIGQMNGQTYIQPKGINEVPLSSS